MHDMQRKQFEHLPLKMEVDDLSTGETSSSALYTPFYFCFALVSSSDSSVTFTSSTFRCLAKLLRCRISRMKCVS